jgi:LPS export ABC transporter protein LptC
MLMSPRRIAKALAIFGCAALALILVVTVWVVRHRSATQALTRLAGVVPNTLLHARNFHWTQMKGDESQWVLQAKEASYLADKTSVQLEGAELSVKPEDGKSIQLIAPHALLKLDGNHISRAELSGGLNVHYGDYMLQTDQATFYPDRDELDAPGAVKVEGEGLTVTGIGLTGHPKAEVFELLKQVSTQIVPRKKGVERKVS